MKNSKTQVITTAFSSAITKAIEIQTELLANINAVKNYTSSITKLKKDIKQVFENVNMNLVVYDETEWFKDPDSP